VITAWVLLAILLQAFPERRRQPWPPFNHMLYDEPRLFMLHFWGVGDPGKIAAGLKAALDKTNSKK
jgi:hypothetical protein